MNIPRRRNSDLPLYAWTAAVVGRPVVLAAALVMSAPGEYALARMAGWDQGVAVLMPVSLSIYAACAAVIAATRPKGAEGRTSALWGAGIALVLAMSAQVVSHLIESGHMQSGAWLVAVVSAVPPLVVAHMLHLAAMPKTSDRDADEAASAPEDNTEDVSASEDSVEVSEVVEEVTVSTPATTKPSLADIAAAVADIEDEGEAPSGQRLGQYFGVSARTGRRYLHDWEAANEMSAPVAA